MMRQVHELEPVADQLERFSEAGFERALQFFFDSAANLVELRGDLGAQLGEREAQAVLERG